MSEALNDNYLDASDDPVEREIEAGVQAPNLGRRRPDFFLPRRPARLVDAMNIRILGPAHDSVPEETPQ